MFESAFASSPFGKLRKNNGGFSAGAMSAGLMNPNMDSRNTMSIENQPSQGWNPGSSGTNSPFFNVGGWRNDPLGFYNLPRNEIPFFPEKSPDMIGTSPFNPPAIPPMQKYPSSGDTSQFMNPDTSSPWMNLFGRAKGMTGGIRGF